MLTDLVVPEDRLFVLDLDGLPGRSARQAFFYQSYHSGSDPDFKQVLEFSPYTALFTT